MNKINEINYNTFGSKMKIIHYKNNRDVDIYFEEYNWVAKNMNYNSFKKGNIKCPYEPRYNNKGYIGEGVYKATIDGKHTRYYDTWCDMLRRCYSHEFHERYPSYIKCEVCEEWLNFQNFAKWYCDNYYEIENEKMCLDKDILVKGNKIYSPDTCIFVPNRINILFREWKNETNIKGIKKSGSKYTSRYQNINGEKIYLGTYDTKEDAFLVYKEFKEKSIKEIADKYKKLIPEKLYKAMYLYKIEITDVNGK